MNKSIVVGLIGLGALARLAPHPWNFTPVLAIALYAGVKSTRWRGAALVTLLALLLSDMVLGFYPGMWVVYAATLIPVVLGRFVREGSALSIAGVAFVSSVSFFLITNAAFLYTTYPHTFGGMMASYTAALPFYRNEIIGDALFTAAIFGMDALLQRRFQGAPQAA